MSTSPSGPDPGTGLLAFERAAGRTALTRALATSPLRVLSPRNLGHAAWVYLSSYGGGLVGGDQLRISVAVAEGAAALVGTQAATRVYRGERPCSQRLRARVAPGGLLVLAPDPLACFAGSSYTQEQDIALAPGASLALLDWQSAGRWAAGERWAGRRFHSRTRVVCEGRPLFQDALLLDPEDGPLAERMDRFNCLALLLLCGPLLGEAGAALLARAAAAPVERTADLVIAGGRPRALGGGGALLRLAGTSTERVAAALRAALAPLAALLGDDPWARRW